ncbi:hypothetical protein Z957_02030 [Clostridium sp. K25]|nr:hypothetical protein Z957_02030 [Clostridium sp. K25]
MEIVKIIITIIIIPLFSYIYNNTPIKVHRKLKWDESNEEKKLWSNYFPPLIAVIILELSFTYVSQQIQDIWVRILIYIVGIIAIFSIEFFISTFWYLNFKDKTEYLSIKHITHLICFIGSIILCFVVEINNSYINFIYIIVILINCILNVYLILIGNKNSYKKLKYIEIEFEDGIVEKNIINYEQHKKAIKLFIKSSSQEIIVKTIYDVKPKKKVHVYY